MRRILKGAIPLTALTLVALAVYFEPTYCVRGWLRDDAYYDGQPTSYWLNELEHWDFGGAGYGCGMSIRTFKRIDSPWQQMWKRYLCEPDPDEEFDIGFFGPKILRGNDPDAFPVLLELMRESP